MKTLEQLGAKYGELEDLLSERSRIDSEHRKATKELEAKVSAARSALAMAITMARIEAKATP